MVSSTNVTVLFKSAHIMDWGLGCDAAAPCGVGLVYGALVGVYVTRSYSDFSQSTVEARPTFGLLKIQYAVRSTDARKIFTPHEPVVGVLGLAVKPPRRGANASCRQFGGSQSTVGSHPNPGCLKYSMGCVSQTCDRFNRRHEPLAVGAARCFV